MIGQSAWSSMLALLHLYGYLNRNIIEPALLIGITNNRTTLLLVCWFSSAGAIFNHVYFLTVILKFNVYFWRAFTM